MFVLPVLSTDCRSLQYRQGIFRNYNALIFKEERDDEVRKYLQSSRRNTNPHMVLRRQRLPGMRRTEAGHGGVLVPGYRQRGNRQKTYADLRQQLKPRQAKPGALFFYHFLIGLIHEV